MLDALKINEFPTNEIANGSNFLCVLLELGYELFPQAVCQRLNCQMMALLGNFRRQSVVTGN
jgi:hypothetical protein